MRHLVVISKGEDIIERTINALLALNPALPPKGSRVMIKPNLVEPRSKDSGAITRPEIVEAIIMFLGDANYQIYIGEGAATFDTPKCFAQAGYLDLEKRYRVRLVDLNQDEFVKIKCDGRYWTAFDVAKTAKDAQYIISAPVMKQHPFRVTLSLKNMMGVLKPQKSYPVKSYIHKEDDDDIWADRLCDLISNVRPHLAVIDGTTGMFGSHLTGRLKRFDVTIASEDALACDMVGARLLGYSSVFYLEHALKRGLGQRPSEKFVSTDPLMANR